MKIVLLEHVMLVSHLTAHRAQCFKLLNCRCKHNKTFFLSVKAMLHEAIFLATCNATMTNKKPFKSQRGCHTFATFFATCNACNNKQDGGRAKQAKYEL